MTRESAFARAAFPPSPENAERPDTKEPPAPSEDEAGVGRSRDVAPRDFLAGVKQQPPLEDLSRIDRADGFHRVPPRRVLAGLEEKPARMRGDEETRVVAAIRPAKKDAELEILPESVPEDEVPPAGARSVFPGRGGARKQRREERGVNRPQRRSRPSRG